MELADLGLSEEDLALRAALRRIVDEEIAPRAKETDAAELFPAHAISVLGDLGMLGIGIPEDAGGSGGTKLQYAIAVEEIARACGSTSLTYMTQVHGATPILLAGDEEQVRRYVPAITSGRSIAAIALTEPQAGSDVASMATSAKTAPGGYRVSGQKIFITNGGHADVVCVFATLDRAAGTEGIMALLVDPAADGVTVGKPLHKMGMRGSDTVELFFEDVFVPEEQVLAEAGQGFRIAMRTLDTARLSTAAQALGLAQGAYGIAFDYAQERRQFGQPIYDFQAVQFRLVDMHALVTTARLLTYQVARAMDADPAGRHSKDAAMAKLWASDCAMRVTTEAVQVLGGYGYMQEYEVERFMRDAKVTQIYDGANDINRLVIGRELRGRARS